MRSRSAGSPLIALGVARLSAQPDASRTATPDAATIPDRTLRRVSRRPLEARPSLPESSASGGRLAAAPVRIFSASGRRFGSDARPRARLNDRRQSEAPRVPDRGAAAAAPPCPESRSSGVTTRISQRTELRQGSRRTTAAGGPRALGCRAIATPSTAKCCLDPTADCTIAVRSAGDVEPGRGAPENDHHPCARCRDHDETVDPRARRHAPCGESLSSSPCCRPACAPPRSRDRPGATTGPATPGSRATTTRRSGSGRTAIRRSAATSPASRRAASRSSSRRRTAGSTSRTSTTR